MSGIGDRTAEDRVDIPKLEIDKERTAVDAEFDELPSKISVRGLNFYYGNHQALYDNNMEIKQFIVTAIIGPSGCGKSTHIRVFNRIYQLYPEQRAEGSVMIDGEDILSPSVDLLKLRKRVGMIFQKPTPFPMSVFENVAYGLRMHYKLSKSEITDRNSPDEMPFLLEVEDGVRRILRGIDRRDRLVHFPWQLSVPMIHLAPNMPDWLYDRLMAGRRRKRKPYIDESR